MSKKPLTSSSFNKRILSNKIRSRGVTSSSVYGLDGTLTRPMNATDKMCRSLNTKPKDKSKARLFASIERLANT